MMNWLSERLAHLRGGFASLAEVAYEESRSSLRRLPYPDLLDRSPFDVDDRWQHKELAESFVLLEDADAAHARFESAFKAPEQLPPSFTLAIDDGSGSVLYLPEDADLLPSLQLFTAYGSRLSRVRAGGQFTMRYANLDEVTIVEPSDDCSDGPCVEWGAGCGGDCACRKYEVTDADLGYHLALGEAFLSSRYKIAFY